MKLPWLKSALENNDGPFLTVYLDTTRTDPAAASEVEARWTQFRAQAAKAGAPDAILAEVEESLLRQPSIGGSHGRAILANGERILLDRVLPVPPKQELIDWGERPVILPLLQLTPHAVSQLLIEVDRAGADLHLRAPEDPDLTKNAGGHGEDRSINGGHDELHKSRATGADSGRGWRTDNFEARVEDSWERNAEAVAEQVNKLVMKRKPHVVFLTGDVRAESLLKAELHKEVLGRLKELSGGTRGLSLERAPFREELARAVRDHIDATQQEYAEKFRETQGRDAGSVAGAFHVAESLRRGQVDELLFNPGREPEDIEELLHQAIITDAGVYALDEETFSLPDGVAALLRWDDGSTPASTVSSMSGTP
ncbi:baeRF2 domain-containing protein [Corynebacterium comes]|uniref:Peptide chain release factor 1 n=1 Tax=Corynebacterium comes TaxID=2675218 RepID=A0A6B8W377_9CORY|nr:Vms1/Ankzf1 family peptidyl-tRNA hydrolase [Corynebacterium comes]QGU04230.1 hypothetical protein CETAM_04795 [Corynebacterium comes]